VLVMVVSAFSRCQVSVCGRGTETRDRLSEARPLKAQASTPGRPSGAGKQKAGEKDFGARTRRRGSDRQHRQR
ncbi:MAG: hypothetical protein ABW179_11345, partial [Methylobacterium sp.]